LGRNEAGDLDLVQAGVLQAMHEADLDFGGDGLLFVLQAVAGANVDEFHAQRKVAHGAVLVDFLVARRRA
jgi:hypothetical protein